MVIKMITWFIPYKNIIPDDYVSSIFDIDYNKLYSNGTYYYLYVDIVNYYYQSKYEYVENKDSYYSKYINLNNKTGYLQIDKYDDKYLIKFMYNYARIETLVDKDQINDAVLNCSYILSTIKFNHNVIKLMLNEDYLVNREEKYDVFTPNGPINEYEEHKDDNQDSISEDTNAETNNNEEVN